MKYIVSAYILFSVVASCQQTSGNNSRTHGACSPAVTGNGNKIIIKTCNIGEANTEKLKSFLSNILITQRNDTVEILSRLNACLTSVEELKEGYWQIIPEQQRLELQKAFHQAIPHNAFPGAMVYVENGQDDHNRGKVASELIYTFQQAGWTSVIAHSTILFGDSDQPVGIVVDAKAENNETADAIARALRSVFGDRVVFRSVNTGRYPINTVEVHIWNRPQ
jgi:hypothetical protein